MWGKRRVFWPRSSVFLPVHYSVVSLICLYIEQSLQLCRHWISTWISNPTQNLATSLRLFGGRLRLIGGHRRSSDIVSGMPKMGENLASNRQILSSKIGTATGVAMPKKTATSRRRPDSATDGCKIVRSIARFCSNFPGFTHRRRVATDLWLGH